MICQLQSHFTFFNSSLPLLLGTPCLYCCYYGCTLWAKQHAFSRLRCARTRSQKRNTSPSQLNHTPKRKLTHWLASRQNTRRHTWVTIQRVVNLSVTEDASLTLLWRLFRFPLLLLFFLFCFHLTWGVCHSSNMNYKIGLNPSATSSFVLKANWYWRDRNWSCHLLISQAIFR